MDREAIEASRRASKLAVTYGLCAVCNVTVGTDGIHAWHCTTVPTERRANHGRAC
jgi:hypothetical protein